MTDKQSRPELEYERDWCRAKIKELQAKYEHAYNALLAEQKENAALVEAARAVVEKGERMAMALSDAQCGYVCEHRHNWTEAHDALAKLIDTKGESE